MNLNCSAKGKPKPHITWTRLSDNSNVTMPLNNINRHSVMDYRCTAENGIGTPSTRRVAIDVQCKYYVGSTSELSHQMIKPIMKVNYFKR